MSWQQWIIAHKLFVGVIVVVVIAVALGIYFGTRGTASPTVTPTTTPIPSPTAPDRSIVIVNHTSQNPLQVSLQLSVSDTDDLWVKDSGNGTLSARLHDGAKNPPDYQLVELAPDDYIVVVFPQFQPWRVTPFTPPGKNGMPILIECTPGNVCNSSAVDGVNYLMRYELTSEPGEPATVIDVVQNPCGTPGDGCLNPAVSGTFAPGTAWDDPTPCYAGTCNLIGESKNYSDLLNTGQCSNSSDTWAQNSRSARCLAESPPGYVIYTYDHSDQNASPPLVSPFKIHVTYKDLN